MNILQHLPTDFETIIPYKYIESIAERYPDRTAVQYERKKFTYRQLNQKANQLAAQLMANNVAPGDPIVVLIDPDCDILVIILAIMKINAIYVPLDPSFPTSRIATILEDVSPKAAITLSKYHSRFASTIECLYLDQEVTTLEKHSDCNPDLNTEQDQVAYIFYTSGTTGKPKGILATHRNLAYYLMSAQQKYQLNPYDVMTSCAKYTFSISLFELLLPLMSGAKVLLLDREHILDLPRMSKTLQHVTFMHMGPSLLKLLLCYIEQNCEDRSVYHRLRHLSSGGDMVPPEVLQMARKLFPEIEIYVIYGCSEISCMGCTWEVPVNKTIERTYVGKPFMQTKLLVVDSDLKPLPKGKKGEVCFSGPGTVKGYLNNLDLTQEKFLKIGNQRFYRTGDIGRIHQNGLLELLGRADFQIQLNGIRIEPSEIEYFIKKHPGIKDCVVTLDSNSSVSGQLVSYYTSYTDQPIETQSLYRYLNTQLPDYMIPAKFNWLKALPLNFNLKVDRKALIDKNSKNCMKIDSDLKTPTEHILADIWKHTLSINTVSRYDNFFDIGGDSLSAVMMILEVNKRLNKSIYGLDVARESLAVIAKGLSDDNERHEDESSLIPVSLPYETKCFYFSPKNELFGVIYQPKEKLKDVAVLICPPVGQELIRTEYIIKSIMKFLGRKGYTSMVFDHYGSGNSFGEDCQSSIDRWQEDQKQALALLKETSDFKKVVVIAMRASGNIALTSFNNYSSKQVAVLLLDPVVSGGNYLSKISDCHSNLVLQMAYVKLFREFFRKYKKNQYLGFSFSQDVINYINNIELSEQIRQFSGKVEVLASEEIEQELLAKNVQDYIPLSESANWHSYKFFDRSITLNGLKDKVLQYVMEFSNEGI
jgi:amino acid adenylation domain-containing protein